MKKGKFPPGWNEERVLDVLNHYKKQIEKEAIAEDDAAHENASYAMMAVPTELVPKVRELIARGAS